MTTGMFGTKQSFVPIADASPNGESVQVPFTKDEVKDAPKVEPDGQLTPEEEQALTAGSPQQESERQER